VAATETISRRAILFGGVSLAAAQSEVAVIRVPDGGIQPQIVVEPDLVHLIYFKGDARAGDVFYCTSERGRLKFAPAVQVNTRPGSAVAAGTIRGAHLAVGKDNRVHVSWNGSVAQSGAKSGMMYAWRDPGQQKFAPERNLMRKTIELDGGGSVAADRLGNVFVAWHAREKTAPEGEDSRQVWISRSSDGGQNFAEERPAWAEATGACGCCGMRLLAAEDSTVYALYRSARNTEHRDVYLLRSDDHGRTFKGRVLDRWNIKACPMSSMYLANVAAGGSSHSNVVAAWETENDVFFADLDGVKPPQKPSEPLSNRKHPAVARRADGSTLMTWVEGSGWQRGGTLAWELFAADGRPVSRNTSAQPVSHRVPQRVPVWSFAAPFACADGSFAILI
jgi:hypothetical protein